MLLIALTPSYADGGTISTKMAGAVLASLSSGAGELSFLGLTHYYGPFSLAAWGSGSGGAGLIGAGAYAIATNSLGLGASGALLASAFLPIIMLVSFFVILPRSPLKQKRATVNITGPGPSVSSLENEEYMEHDRASIVSEHESLLHSPASSSSPSPGWRSNLLLNLRRARGLFFP